MYIKVCTCSFCIPSFFQILRLRRLNITLNIRMSSHLFEVKIAFSLDTYFRIVCSIKLKIRIFFFWDYRAQCYWAKAGEKKWWKKSEIRVTSNSKLFQVAPNSNYVLETRNLISEGIFNSVTFSKKLISISTLHFSANVEIEDWTKLKISFWIKPPLYCTLRS